MKFIKEEIILLEALKNSFNSIPKSGLINHKLSLLVALSGGLDSQVLFYALLKFGDYLKINFEVCHVDHGLRETSSVQAMQVQKLCAEFNVSCLVLSAPMRDMTKNIEQWAREIRYKLLEEARQLKKCDYILTAHHAGDQAETFLFSILSGRGIKFLSGIEPLNIKRQICRPFLNVPKQIINHCALLWSIREIYDESNSDLNRSRNRIRHRLIPELKENYNPSVEEGLSTIQNRIREDENYLWNRAEKILDNYDTFQEILQKEPDAIIWRCLYLYSVKQLGECAQSIGYLKLTELVNALRREVSGPRVFELGNGINCYVSGRLELVFTHNSEKQD